MMLQIRIGLCFMVLMTNNRVAALGDPPFAGTIFIDPDIITSTDPTTFQSASYAGRGKRRMFDRRAGWIEVNAYLFNASFDDGLTAEIQVNPEFGNESAASIEAQKYGQVIGRLPTGLRTDVETVWIPRGEEPLGGGNNNLLIHTERADLSVADGILEETLVHEAAHTSLDAAHATAPGWLASQTADGEFISTYARDNSNREDIAESFLPYLAVRYRPDRIPQSLADVISQTIPNRIAYFDNQPFSAYPLEAPPRARFVRGDCNDDGSVDISDAVFSLGDLFLGEGDPGCDDACDTNDDGSVDISDAIATLGVLFLGQGLIPPPGMKECGIDPTDEEVGCEQYNSCS